MEYQKIMLLIVGLLVVVAVYLAVTSPAPVKRAPDSGPAQELLLKSAGFGKGLGGYTYAYSEVSDGYKTSYVIQKDAGLRLARIQNPLSQKGVYLLQNDTILCISYPTDQVCGSIYGNADLQNYVSFVDTKFFNDTLIDRSTVNVMFLVKRGYLKLDPNITDRAINGKACRQISYVIDYSNISLDEAARFSIGSDSPKTFYLTNCIDNESGLSYENTLKYADKAGNQHERVVTVASFSSTAPQIQLPANTSGDPVKILTHEREAQVVLARCFTDKAGAEQEKCISDLALNLHRKDLCEMTGSRKDRCLVSLVPLTKDITICGAVSDPSFRDDCFIELAGAYKDSSYCSSVKDQAKLQSCTDAAKPKETGNKTSVDVNKLLDSVDKSGGNTTALPANNSTIPANSS
ncbi:MAG: hypothetical protein U0R44_06855 [Candidatus Micrarchaeia archaeon]